ncbi:MAG: family 10 glycosylhydrolase [Bacilli bacterium]|nr:family 10 glycosylhydrolase [Bacilli bacterium]
MKKILIILLIILIFIYLINIDRNDKDIRQSKEKRAIFISYIELNNYISNDTNSSKKNIKKIIKKIKHMKFNMIILQVRSFSDAIYKSNIFPWSSIGESIEGEDPGFDILDYFIKESHKENIELYTWINPYRVRNNNDINSISTNNPAFKYKNTDTLYINNGIFYNPAKEEVIDLIVDGVEEIVKNYKVDGVLFDDYFYPSNDIDINDYNNYLKNNNYISIEDYHLKNVNKLIKKVHQVCSKYKVEFGISPDGNIENNYNKNYADVKTWCKNKEYIDFIMPQIYYGFKNENKDFISVSKEWESIVEKDIDLYIALAFYKIGTIDKYAKSGNNEWIDNNDIIMREIMISRNLHNYKGFALFRYDYLFNSKYKNNNIEEEIKNIKKILK